MVPDSSKQDTVNDGDLMHDDTLRYESLFSDMVRGTALHLADEPALLARRLQSRRKSNSRKVEEYMASCGQYTEDLREAVMWIRL
jgi:hypothetical protein